MKRRYNFQILAILVFVLGMTSNIFAQEQKGDDRKATIKIIKEVDGKVTKVDRTIELQEGESLQDALKRTGLDKEMESVGIGGEDMDVDVDIRMEGEEKHAHKVKKRIFIGEDGKKCCEKREAENCCAKKIHKIEKIQHNSNKASLGVMLTQKIENENGVETNSGILVKDVLEGSAAEAAGLKAGDILKGVDGKEVIDYKEVLDALSKFEVGDKVAIDYERNGERASTEATLKANSHQWTSKDGEDHKVIIKKRMNGEEVDIEKILEGIELEDGKEGNVMIIKKRMNGGEEVDIEKVLEGIELEDGKEGNVMIIKKRMNGDDVEIEKIIEDIELEDGKQGNVMIIKKRMNGEGEVRIEVENEVDFNVWIKDVEKADVEKIENTSLKKAAVENTLKVESLQFYPNPSDGRFDLSFNLSEKGNTVVRVVDMAGKEVFQDKLGKFTGTYEKQIDISGQSNGVYFLQVEQNNQIMMKKIVIQ